MGPEASGGPGGRAVVEVSDLVVRFGSIEALAGVSIRVDEGEFFGLLGPNGAGKTTLVRVLTGQLSPTSGVARTMGAGPEDPVGMRRGAGIVPEAESPPTFLTAQEFLELVCRIRGVGGLEESVARWLGFFEMEDKRDALCRDLSKGQRQKLMLAAALIHEPALLILDEPFINLDPIFQRRTGDLLRGLTADGTTVLMCTHILDIAERLCSRVAVINRGRIMAVGALEELRERRGERLEDVFLRLVEGGS
ncbi:MAG: ABC transporter ATP-binding protein [Thermoplasmatota archaeon]